jgi:hypothetical protein
MNKDARIREILTKFDEDFASTTWLVQGQRVIYHSALERIAAKAKISWDEPAFVISSADHSVIKASGHLPYEDHDRGTARWEWAVGEAHIGVNYRVSGKQAAYPFAMAEKRAKDRVILKLIQLHGLLYSEDEADDFKASAAGSRPKVELDLVLSEAPVMDDKPIPYDGPLEMHNPSQGEPGYRPPEAAAPARREIMFGAISSGKTIVLDDGEVHPSEALKRLIKEQGTSLGVQTLMLKHEIQTYLSGIPLEHKNELRDFAKSRMVDLGWGKKAND